ncbi:TetR/AcrR family transcriptional regulator [Nocardia sp. NPDC058658]|uniref:TetR/AcrR family transcriptional regulator n=1 Tax=Nocardia sp. NPDC058658 TaxID=3346580 RepID=UPI003667C2A5
MSATTPRRKRADARRSIDSIIGAARAELSKDPQASVDDIAVVAGVGRMTVYGHFPNRAALVEAALAAALAEGDEMLAAADLSGNAERAMIQLLGASWALIAESSALLTAAVEALPAGRIQQLHDSHAERMDELIRRGQRQGEFRTDLPVPWLRNVIHYVLKGAAEEVGAGRVRSADAAGLVTATVLPVLASNRAPS